MGRQVVPLDPSRRRTGTPNAYGPTGIVSWNSSDREKVLLRFGQRSTLIEISRYTEGSYDARKLRRRVDPVVADID